MDRTYWAPRMYRALQGGVVLAQLWGRHKVHQHQDEISSGTVMGDQHAYGTVSTCMVSTLDCQVHAHTLNVPVILSSLAALDTMSINCGSWLLWCNVADPLMYTKWERIRYVCPLL